MDERINKKKKTINFVSYDEKQNLNKTNTLITQLITITYQLQVF